MWLHRVITADSYPDKTGQELIKIHWQNCTISCTKDTGNFRLAYTAVCRITPGDYGGFISRKNGTAGKSRLTHTLLLHRIHSVWLHRVITADSYPDKTGQELIKIHWQNCTISCTKDTGNFRLAYTAVCRITPGDYGGFISRKNGTAAKITWQKRTDSCNKNTGNFRLAHTLL